MAIGILGGMYLLLICCGIVVYHMRAKALRRHHHGPTPHFPPLYGAPRTPAWVS